MMLIEIAHPAGALTVADHELLADRIRSVLLETESAPEETMRRGRAMTHIAFRELHDWQTGDGPLTPGTAPPMIITITVPELWREEVSRHTIGTIRAAVRRLDVAHNRPRTDGHLWVNVHGVSEGSIGLDGKATDADGVLDSMTRDFRTAQATGTARPIPDGTLVDPICGMLVRPGKGAITLDHDGTTVGFCALACRDAYVRRRT